MGRHGRTAGRAATVTAAAVAAGATALGLAVPAAAQGEDDFEQPPGYEAPAAPQIDATAPGLKLGDGATLAAPRVLDIKFVTESLGEPPDPPAETGSSPSPSGSAEPDPTAPPGGGAGEGVAGTGGTRVERTGDQRKFTLQTDVLFGKGSAEVGEETRDALAVVAQAIAEQRPASVNIFGFTDDLGSYESGIALSNDRARNTHRVLVDLLGDASGITFNVRGYSEDYPLYSNDTEEGRTKNRRVEVSWPMEG